MTTRGTRSTSRRSACYYLLLGTSGVAGAGQKEVVAVIAEVGAEGHGKSGTRRGMQSGTQSGGARPGARAAGVPGDERAAAAAAEEEEMPHPFPIWRRQIRRARTTQP